MLDVTIYAKPARPYRTSAKQLLASKGVAFAEIDTTVPQIFISGLVHSASIPCPSMVPPSRQVRAPFPAVQLASSTF
jgi:hypothetical protein